MRRRGYVPLRCLGDVPLRCLSDVPPRRHWVFHLRRTSEVAGTYKETSLRRPHEVLLPGENLLNYHLAHFCNITTNFQMFLNNHHYVLSNYTLALLYQYF